MRKAILVLLILTIPLVMAAAPSDEHRAATFSPSSDSIEDYCNVIENFFDYELGEFPIYITKFPIYITNLDILDSCSVDLCETNEELGELANFVETDIISDCSDYLADQDTLGIYCSDKETGDLSEPASYTDCLDVGHCSDESSTSREDCLASLFISDLGTSEDWTDIIEDDSHSFHPSRDVSFGDDFYKEKFNDIIDSTWAFEFQASGSPDYYSTVDFAISHALSDEGYCISSEKIDTYFGEKYMVFLEDDTYTTISDSTEIELSPSLDTTLLSTGATSTGGEFNNIDSHLKLAYDGFSLNIQGTPAYQPTYLTLPEEFSTISEYLASLDFGEKCDLMSTLSEWRSDNAQTLLFNRNNAGTVGFYTPFYSGFKNSDLTTSEYLHSNYRNVLWSEDATGDQCHTNLWLGDCYVDDYLNLNYEYKTPSDPSSLESEYEWITTNEIIYSRLNNDYTVEEAVVENSDSTIRTLLEDLGLDRIFAFAPTLDVWYKFNFEPKFTDNACFGVEGECVVVEQIDYFGIKGDSMVTNFNSEGTYGIKGAVRSILQNSTKNIPFLSTFDMGEIEVTKTYVGISTNLESTNVAPDQDFTFTLQGISLSGNDIASFLFDPGQREVPNGIYTLTASGDFECSETSGVVCSGHTSYFDASIGKGKGNPCACPKSDSGSGNVYAGQKSGTSTEALFQPYFDGESFEYEFNMNYPSKTSCGPDRVCQAVLEVTDAASNTATHEIELYLPGVQSCSTVYPNSIPGTNTSSFVGYINDGEDSCQCKNGYERTLDEEVNALTGGYAYDCTKIVVETPEDNTTTNTTNTTNTTTDKPDSPYTGKNNPTHQNNQKRDPSEHKDSFPKTSKEDSSSGLTIFLIVILIVLMGIFGFEFYRKKKTGEFFNPFKKSPTSVAGPPSEPASGSPIQKFISDAKAAGEDPATIKQNLKNSGWPEEEINKYL